MLYKTVSNGGESTLTIVSRLLDRLIDPVTNATPLTLELGTLKPAIAKLANGDYRLTFRGRNIRLTVSAAYIYVTEETAALATIQTTKPSINIATSSVAGSYFTLLLTSEFLGIGCGASPTDVQWVWAIDLLDVPAYANANTSRCGLFNTSLNDYQNLLYTADGTTTPKLVSGVMSVGYQRTPVSATIYDPVANQQCVVTQPYVLSTDFGSTRLLSRMRRSYSSYLSGDILAFGSVEFRQVGPSTFAAVE